MYLHCYFAMFILLCTLKPRNRRYFRTPHINSRFIFCLDSTVNILIFHFNVYSTKFIFVLALFNFLFNNHIYLLEFTIKFLFDLSFST